MSAELKEEVVIAQKEVNVAKELKKLSVDVKLNPKTELVDDKLVVTFDEDTYLANAEANGVSELEIKRVQKFHSEFLKGVVKATGEELISGYPKHKTATGFTMDMETTLGKVSLFGDKHTTHSVKGVEYTGTGMTMKHKYQLPGVKASMQAVKATIFNSFK